MKYTAPREILHLKLHRAMVNFTRAVEAVGVSTHYQEQSTFSETVGEARRIIAMVQDHHLKDSVNRATYCYPTEFQGCETGSYDYIRFLVAKAEHYV